MAAIDELIEQIEDPFSTTLLYFVIPPTVLTLRIVTFRALRGQGSSGYH